MQEDVPDPPKSLEFHNRKKKRKSSSHAEAPTVHIPLVPTAISPLTEHPHHTNPFRRVSRVSRHAALTTKQVVWDSNDASIHAALSAVDQWEGLYHALRSLVVTCGQSVQTLYFAARDTEWVVVPMIARGAEYVVVGTVRGICSPQVWRAVPVVGETVLEPAVATSLSWLTQAWDTIVQMPPPIPSREAVRDTVDGVLNGTKNLIMAGAREVVLYTKRADANMTRALSHTQWKVLGTGPYATLPVAIKADVVNHLCERYVNIKTRISRYEWTAHLRAHNRPLYHDLIGVLRERMQDEQWLHLVLNREPFLLEDLVDEENEDEGISALWFYLENVNGESPGTDGRWRCFQRAEQISLERQYRDIVYWEKPTSPAPTQNNLQNQLRFPTIAKWYEPDERDVLVDEHRHAVSFFLCCPLCRAPLPEIVTPKVAYRVGDLCEECIRSQCLPSTSATVPGISMIRRPTFWRFHGLGDAVRRSSWMLDTKRYGVQPFDEEAQAILEDAYRFLQLERAITKDDEKEIDGALLTVEVPSPEGGTLLVQFSSLSHATAIQQGLKSSFVIFKHRVYRGAWLQKAMQQGLDMGDIQPSIEETIVQASGEQGTLGDTLVPDVNIRNLLLPVIDNDNISVLLDDEETDNSLAVPPSRLRQDDMLQMLQDSDNTEIDHLVLIVHGIGEMLRSIDVFGLALPNLSTIIDCCGYMRNNHKEVHDTVLRQLQNEGIKDARAEYLPVEWHETFSILSRRRSLAGTTDENREASGGNVMMDDISLRTIPNMRNFANDTLMDVLYFMSPEHHDIMIDVVADEMKFLVEKFRRLTGFTGGISLVGHSLGSIIAWDILANQVEKPRHLPKVGSLESVAASAVSYTTLDSPKSGTTDSSIKPRSLTEASDYPQLPFPVDNFFLLGSPVPVFLMIRNQRCPLKDSYFLPGCRRVFNLFHPFDPVAYRIEPCIDPTNAEFEPIMAPHWNGGLRVQYQTKYLWKKLVDTTTKTRQNVVEAIEAGVGNIFLLGSSPRVSLNEDEDMSSELSSEENFSRHVKTGSLNRGWRIDYMLQEKEIESANEYVAAFAAHSSYWIEKDLSLFIARQIHLGRLEKEVDWESIQSSN